MQTIVIGAGASGMAAAITASRRPGNRVRLLERQNRVGRKLSATGNGRCNLTNLSALPSSYHSDTGADFFALQAFPVSSTLSFFEKLGLVWVSEEAGRCYPLSDQATSVVDVLRFALDASGVQTVLGCEVQSVQIGKHGFHLETSSGDFSCDKLIIACGGPASEKLGATSDGARFLRMLGHSVTPLSPGLVQLCSPEPLLKSLKGIRAQASMQLLHHGDLLFTHSGEVQFVDGGVSGPAIFDLSRVADKQYPCQLLLDFLPQFSHNALLSAMENRVQTLPELTTDDLFTGMIHNRLGRVLVRKAGIEASVSLGSLLPAQLEKCCTQAKAFSLELTGSFGMENAQITIGGADASQFHPKTLESLLVPGLYACGEVLDVDGPCGGFNLQWAWSSGMLAGSLCHEVTP